jgi:hypothetical protein
MLMTVRDRIILAATPLLLAVSPVVGLSDRSREIQVEVKTPLVEKYLPGYTFTARPSDRTLVATDKETGRSVPLDAQWMAPPEEENTFRVPDVSRLLAGVGIFIRDAQTAIEVAQLVENLTRFGPQMPAERDDWKYTAVKARNSWIVTVTYVGPPAMIREPPVYEIQTTNGSRFVEIRFRPLIRPPARKR